MFERRDFTRPLIISTLFTVIGELVLLLYYGVYLGGEGNLVYKVIWTLGFCGIGMGLTLGGFIDIFLVGRVTIARGICFTVIFSTVILGVGCNWLCMSLDRRFNYFGGAKDPVLHFMPSFLASIFLGWSLGWLLFTPKGKKLLEKFGA